MGEEAMDRGMVSEPIPPEVVDSIQGNGNLVGAKAAPVQMPACGVSEEVGGTATPVLFVGS